MFLFIWVLQKDDNWLR